MLIFVAFFANRTWQYSLSFTFLASDNRFFFLFFATLGCSFCNFDIVEDIFKAMLRLRNSLVIFNTFSLWES